jgi:hypothetical protein
MPRGDARLTPARKCLQALIQLCQALIDEGNVRSMYGVVEQLIGFVHVEDQKSSAAGACKCQWFMIAHPYIPLQPNDVHQH